jgi:ABC-2 type transport system permease protein
MVKDYAFKGPPYPTSLDMVNYLRNVTPPEFQYLYEDWFENHHSCSTIAPFQPAIRLFRTASTRSTSAVEAKKYRSDGKGQEHLIPLHDLVDIGVLDADGNYLYLQKHKIEQERQEFTVTVNKVPSQAGIDPLIKLIDRNPDDNVTEVKRQ